MKILIATMTLNSNAPCASLVSRGYDVVAADDGAQAIELAARTRPDVMILDLGMPNVDGIDVIRAVRAWSKVPILVLSGRTDSAEKVDALDAGADDYVTKCGGPTTERRRVPPPLRGPAAPQTRARAIRTTPLPQRTRTRVPLRTVSPARRHRVRRRALTKRPRLAVIASTRSPNPSESHRRQSLAPPRD